MKHSATLILAAAALISCTSDPKPSAGVASADSSRKCFFSSQVNSFQAVDENVVNIRVGVSDVYELTMFAPCRDVDWAHRIAIVSRGGGSSICTGLDAEIISPVVGGRSTRCQVRDIRHLTPQEVAALPAKAKP